MNCTTHKRYKGIRYPKNKCPDCLKVYQFVQNKASEYGKYVSLTTENMKCGLSHLLAEIATTMLYGKQPELFWLQKSEVGQNIKKFFNETKKSLGFWMKSNPAKFKDTEDILWSIFVKYWKGIKFKENNFKEEKPEEVLDINAIDVMEILDESEIKNIEKRNINSFFNEE